MNKEHKKPLAGLIVMFLRNEGVVHAALQLKLNGACAHRTNNTLILMPAEHAVNLAQAYVGDMKAGCG